MEITEKRIRELIQEEILKEFQLEPVQSHAHEPKVGDLILNTNPGCKHFKSSGVVKNIKSLPDDMGKTVVYICLNSGPNWNRGDELTKTMDQVELVNQEVSESFRYHIKNDISLCENIYRPGSEMFFSLFRESRKHYNSGFYSPKGEEIELLESHEIGEFGIYEGEKVPLDFPMLEQELDEAKYKGREVTLGAKGAQRGEGGKAYVYVRDPKTGNVKKVTFGSSMADAMGDSDEHKKRRKSFGDRHQCSKKKDKTKPGYWACRATKMFGRNIPGWW